MEIRQILHYNLFEKIGEGISGEVYRAWDNDQQKPAAVKILRRTPASQHLTDRLSTARALIHQEHPNIGRIYHVVEKGDLTAVVMEHVTGQSLADIISCEDKTDYNILDIFAQAARGLKEIHAMKLLHGNLKPSNIMVSSEGIVKLIDAGLSLFEDYQLNPEFEAPAEAYHYLSPEQVLNQDITVKSDLFSLGGIFYRCVAGELPFDGVDANDICRSILDYQPNFTALRSRGTSGDKILLLEKLLAKEPEDRLTSSSELEITLREMRSFHDDYQKLQALMKPPPSSRRYVSIAVLVALLLIFWYVVTSGRH
ncbi:MAG: serine/threonine-protein kinase [Candidatus Zixiibacteriota bacterium]